MEVRLGFGEESLELMAELGRALIATLGTLYLVFSLEYHGRPMKE